MIVQGDAAAVLASMRAASVDAIVTSPPYDAVRDYHGTAGLDLPGLGVHVHRVLRDGGMAAVVLADGTHDGAKSGTSVRMAAGWLDAGLRIWETVVYARPGRPGAWWNTRLRVDHETVWLFVKGRRLAYFDKRHLAVPSKHAGAKIVGTQRTTAGHTERIGGERVVAATKCRGTVWPYASSNAERNPTKREHPAPFPDALASDLVRAFCPPGGVVLDPFAGSGTTVVAARNAGRYGLGVDLSATYCRIAMRRLAAECDW